MRKASMVLFFLAVLLGTLCAQKITVTSPVAGALWTRGSSQTITWTRSGSMQATCAIRLRAAGTTEADPAALAIANGEANDGAFPWTVPDSIAPGQYFIRVRTDDSTVIGDSGVFSIVVPFSVLSPSSGETWWMGEGSEIRWQADSSAGSQVRIELLNSAASQVIMTVAASAPNSGSYAWTIPASLPEERYCLRVASASIPGLSATSGGFYINSTHCGTLASLSASSGHPGDIVNLAGQWPVTQGKHCVVFVSNSGIVSVPIPIIWTAGVIQVKVPSEEPGPHRVMVRCKCDSDRFSSNALEFMVLGQPTDFVIEAVKFYRDKLLVKVMNNGNAFYCPFDLKLTIAELGYSRVTIFPATLFNENQEMTLTLAFPPWPEGKNWLLCEVIFDSMNRVAETNELNNFLYQKVFHGEPLR